MFVSSVARRSTRSLVRYQLQKKIHFNSSVCNHFKLIQNSSHQYTFSTIPLDGSGSSAFLSSSNSNDTASLQAESSSTESIYSQSPSLEQPSSTLSTLQFQQQIQQWMSVNPRIAPYKAEELLSKLWVEQQDIFSNYIESAPTTAVQPDIILTTELVNLVLKAWCFSNNGQVSAERAERLLHWMEDLHTSQSSIEWSHILPKPNYQSYATVIDAWSRAAVHESNNPTSTTDEMETKSRGRTKSNVVSSATKAGFDCAKNAEDVLMHMQRMHEEQTQVEGYNSEIQPDTRVFNLVIEAWSKIKGGTKASATRAMRILDLMQELHFQSANDSWQGVMLSKVQPNLQTYKLVLYAWAHATHTVDGPDRAEEILRHLLSMSKAGNLGAEILPDAECFHIVMKAHTYSLRKGKGDDGLASVERAHKVSDLLEWMEMLAVRSKIQPTTESYRIAISAWVWSHHIDAPVEAEKILTRMIRVHDMHHDTTTNARSSTKLKKSTPQVLPSTQDFNTIINCCSYARRVGVDKSEEDDESLALRQIEHKEIYDIAERVFKTLIASTYAQPDSATFAGIIRACNNLLPNTDERDDIVIDYFRLAYHTNPPADDTSARISSTSRDRMAPPPGGGCVDANVLRQLRNALPSTELYIQVRELFEQHRRHNSNEE